NRDYLITTWVQSAGDTFDVSAFSSGVPTFIGKDYWNLPTVDLVMQLRKLFLIEFQLLFVFFLAHFLVKRNVGKQRHCDEREGFKLRVVLWVSLADWQNAGFFFHQSLFDGGTEDFQTINFRLF